MRADSPLWRVMGDPAQAQEAEALAAVRNLLPDDGIARAWANVTFTDNDGRLNEVDVLILTRGGLIVVELNLDPPMDGALSERRDVEMPL
ncbi:NERD domain-containing protein [Microbacterium schleiferi]|uniref:NERD domain-containing protein n=1 Tax=Microbacterium schleiferi TaxID=69362 RepID=A0A7S8RFY2_9MICO|nr:nuclease-related domain-containing protein [Microbacterium schleiferi]QPE03361.1 NERD domain-containing protein [Microbacterium schleiferi]